MTIYILLICFLIIIYLLSCKYPSKKYLSLIFLLLFLIYALRNVQVGCDLSGYKEVYMEARKHDLWDFSYHKFERGYMLLMGISAHLGLSFQGFLVLISFMTLAPIYLFIKHFSVDVVFSSFIYVCLDAFFAFNFSGLRQALAISIILCGFLLYFSGKRGRIIKYLLCVLVATTFHQSAALALCFIPFFFLKEYKFAILSIILIGFIMIIFRQSILAWAQQYTTHIVGVDSKIYVGGFLILLVGVAVFCICIGIIREQEYKSIVVYNPGSISREISNHPIDQTSFFVLTEIFLFGIVCYVVFGYSSLLRATQYATITMLVLLPNALSVLRKPDRTALKVLLVAFLIAFFISQTLIADTLYIVPYKFFWE